MIEKTNLKLRALKRTLTQMILHLGWVHDTESYATSSNTNMSLTHRVRKISSHKTLCRCCLSQQILTVDELDSVSHTYFLQMGMTEKTNLKLGASTQALIQMMNNPSIRVCVVVFCHNKFELMSRLFFSCCMIYIRRNLGQPVRHRR